MHGSRMAIAVALAASVFGSSGCGSSTGSHSPDATETADGRAPVPRGWSRVVNPRSGFSVALPPGWTARGARGTTVIRSADHAIAIAISADRSESGRETPPASYAETALQALKGYRSLHVGRATAIRGLHYPGARVRATGVYSASRVRQAIELVALRRGTAVTYSLTSFRTATANPAIYAAALKILLGSFRAQPPQY